MSEDTCQAFAEAHWRALWNEHGRLKPGEVPPPYPGAQRTGKNTLFRKIKQTMTHPLDKAAEAVSNAGTSMTSELLRAAKDSKDAMKLCDISILATRTLYEFLRQAALEDLAQICAYWLENLGISDPWQAMREEYDRAKAKHGDMTLDSDKPTNEQRFFAVVEEVGEIARALTYDQDNAGELISEITQLGALALAWLAYELGKDTTK